MKHKCKIFRKGKKQAGITLVALVVTIVVLLILAGVSIRLVLDNNGIITKAGDARDKTYIEAIKEAKEMWDTEQYLGSATEGTLAEYLYNKGVITEEEKTIVDNNGEIKKGNYSISFERTVKTVVEAFKDGDLAVGDWVNYQNPTTVSADVKTKDSNYSDTGYTSLATRTGMSTEDGYSADLDQTYSLTNNGKVVNWRILGLSNDGRLMLTTGSPLQRDYDTSTALSVENNPYFYLRGAKGTSTEYGIAELNKICAIYTNNLADEVRSLTIDDINSLCKVTVDVANAKVTKEGDTTTNIDKWGNIGTTYSYPTSSYPTQYESPEDYIAGNKVTTLNSFNKTSDAYYYEGSDAIDSKLALYDILFARTGQTDGDYRDYWLASRAVYVGSDRCGWGPGDVGGGKAYSGGGGMFGSSGGSGGGYGAVRPVVYLKSDVTVDQLQKANTPTSGEEAWDYSW